MKKTLTKGDTGTATTTVNENNTASAMKSGNLNVFATPALVALVEEAACNCITEGLEPGQTSVGINISMSHVAASPLHANITAFAILQEVDGRKLTFAVSAKDENAEIGHGTHVRFLVEAERFMSKLS